MTINNPPGAAGREKTAITLFLASIALAVLSMITSIIIGASMPMVAIAFAACLFSILPIIAILRILKIRTIIQKRDIHSSNSRFLSVRTLGLLFGVLLLFFIAAAVLTSYEIYDLDIPGGILIALAGFVALAASAIYQPAFAPSIQYTTLPQNSSSTPRKEIIHEHEVIVKMRCQYCGYTFDERLDQCPTCGAKK